MWQPDPAWQRLPGVSDPPPSACGAPRSAGRPVAVKRLVAPASGGPSWRRAADVALAGLVDASPGLRAPADGRGGGRRRDHPGLRRGWTRSRPTGCSWPPAWVGSPVPPSATRAGWSVTSSARGSPGSSERGAGGPWPGPRWPTSPTTCGGTGPSVWTASTPCRWWPSTATRPGPTCPAGWVTTWWRSTGATSATGPSAATSATTHCRPRRSSSPCSRRTSRPYPRAWRPRSRRPWAPGSPRSTRR